jgi:hypothetical protein
MFCRTLLTILLTSTLALALPADPVNNHDKATITPAPTPEPTPTPSDITCSKYVCDGVTNWCYYWGGITGWDRNKGQVPGFTRTPWGYCGQATAEVTAV